MLGVINTNGLLHQQRSLGFEVWSAGLYLLGNIPVDALNQPGPKRIFIGIPGLPKNSPHGLRYSCSAKSGRTHEENLRIQAITLDQYLSKCHFILLLDI